MMDVEQYRKLFLTARKEAKADPALSNLDGSDTALRAAYRLAVATGCCDRTDDSDSPGWDDWFVQPSVLEAAAAYAVREISKWTKKAKSLPRLSDDSDIDAEVAAAEIVRFHYDITALCGLVEKVAEECGNKEVSLKEWLATLLVKAQEFHETCMEFESFCCLTVALETNLPKALYVCEGEFKEPRPYRLFNYLGRARSAILECCLPETIMARVQSGSALGASKVHEFF